MAKVPNIVSEIDPEDTPQAKAKAAARKAAKAAAIAETYVSAGKSRTKDVVTPPDSDQMEDLKLRELLQAVADAGDFKKPQAKPVIEATLVALGEALAAGRDLNLAGLGKVKVKRSKVANGRRVSELRIRQDITPGSKTKSATDRVAEGDEDS